jgi:agarase
MPGVKDIATGFFRVAEKDGRWRVIDPLGRGMVLLGVDHVTYHGHHSQRTGRSMHHEANRRKFPDKRDWENDTIARLRKWGFNLLGAGCDGALKHRGLVHTIFLSVGDGLCRDPERPDLYICPNERRPCSAFPNVFHPQFAAWTDWKARVQCAPNRADPWLFGYFIDNELAWWGRGSSATGLFDAVSRLPETHSAKIAQRRFLAERGVAGLPSHDDKLAFLKLAADIYFRVSCEAIRRHDPNHLVMGARFAGLWGAHPAVWETAGKYCDLVTFNVYPWADLDRNAVFMSRSPKAERAADAFARLYGHVEKPMLVTEWSFPALDSGLPCTGGAGQRFRTQAQRTQATELFARTMLSLPFLVGYDYFMWVDEPAAGISDAFPEDSNYGLVNENGDAYPEITSMFERLHREVAERGGVRMPQERAAPSPTGMTVAELLVRLPPFRGKGGTDAEFSNDDEGYALENSVGLQLLGRIGGRHMLDAVTLRGNVLGSYNGMLCENVDGGRRWQDATRVVGAQMRDGTLFVTSEGEGASGGKFSFTHAIRAYDDRPWFLCELVETRNLGDRPMDVRSFYFREYAPYFADKLKMKVKKVPNLWKAPRRDAWFRQGDGAYFGALTYAPTATTFLYHVMDGGRSQHPDAEFAPERKLVIPPGGTYRPRQGSIWMLAVCGLDGVEGWRCAVDGVDAVVTDIIGKEQRR